MKRYTQLKELNVGKAYIENIASFHIYYMIIFKDTNRVEYNVYEKTIYIGLTNMDYGTEKIQIIDDNTR